MSVCAFILQNVCVCVMCKYSTISVLKLWQYPWLKHPCMFIDALLATQMTVALNLTSVTIFVDYAATMYHVNTK